MPPTNEPISLRIPHGTSSDPHFLRNQVAHHEPVHKRNLQSDLDAISDVVDWIDPTLADWMAESSRTASVIATRP